MTQPGFAKQCGVCHVGGGSMEYDYDMKAYGDPTSTDVVNTYTYRVNSVDGSGNAIAGGIVATSTNASNELLGDNKAEVDCMMCHMDGLAVSAAYYASIGCNSGNPVGPADNANCNGFYDQPFMPNVDGPNPDTRFTFTPGQIYDSFNRNMATSLGWFKQAAAAGLGASINLQTGALSNVPATIPGAKIAYVPNSENCAQCHARTNLDKIGRPQLGLSMESDRYGGMTAGFGNYYRMTPAGGAFDWDKISATGTCASNCDNDTTWFEFGCKTGMGKRAQRAGVGTQDRFGFGLCLGCASFNAMLGDMSTGWFIGMDGIPNTADDGVCAIPAVQAACNAKAGATLQGSAGQWMGIFENPMTMLPKKIANKMSDTDVHDTKNVGCATCHNTVSGDRPARTVTGNGVSYTYTALTGASSLQKIDHQMAQGWSTMEKADDINDGTVTCESCHIERDHPNTGTATVPAHAGFPAVHFEKIDCRTCHIPRVYASPGRLLFRDWTAGAYRQTDGSNGNANHFEFAFDFSEGASTPIAPLKAWITAGGHTKITGVLTSMLPVWTAPAKRASDGRVLGWAPAKTRDITAAAAIIAAANRASGNSWDLRINGTNEISMFQGFHLADPLKIESEEKMAALATELSASRTGLAAHAAVADPRMNLFPLFFDVSHGITPKTDALGASSKGGCVMCHSSSNPASPYYSASSVGFFDESRDMLKNGLMQMADYDCGGDDMQNQAPSDNMWANAAHPDWMCGMFDGMGPTAGACDAAEFAACKSYIGSQLMPMFGIPAEVAQAMPVDGIDFHQIMNLREGKMMLGCDSRLLFFGFPTAGRMDAGLMTNSVNGPTNGCVAAEDFFSRDELRKHYKKNLQQTTKNLVTTGTWTNPVTGVSEESSTSPEAKRRVFSIVSRAKNPSNAADTGAKFDMGATCITNPMTGATGPCPTDGTPGMMNTRISNDQLLGYSAEQKMILMSMFSSPTSTLAPVGRFTYSATELAFNFDASSSSGTGNSYAWSFGDGASGSGVTASHTYAAPGYYTVRLVASNADGSSITYKTVAAMKTNTTPTAAGTLVVSGATATVGDSSTDPDGDALAIHVSWGDGQASGGAAGGTFSHVYSVGTYSVYITATDKKGGLNTTFLGVANVVGSGGTVTGMVRDNAGNPMASAIVTLYSASTGSPVMAVYSSKTTTGVYSMANVAPGSYNVKAQKGGYFFDLVSGVTVTSLMTATADITSLPTFTVSGTIINAPASGVLVQLIDEATGTTMGQALAYQYTGGAFRFKNIPHGSYTIDPVPTAPATTSPNLVTAVTVTTMDVVSSATITYNP